MFAIAPTDLDWLERMREPDIPRLVNFWTPTPWHVRRLQPGSALYFLAKHPHRKIAGFGTFFQYVEMTVQDAWVTFGRGNGADSAIELFNKVSGFAKKRAKEFKAVSNPIIGCILLTDPLIVEERHWITPAECGLHFPREVVKIKYFDVLDSIAERLGASADYRSDFSPLDGTPARRTASRKDRVGQAQFRRNVLLTYNHRCAVTNDATSELLEAAHIQPYVNELSNHRQNGICLRVDIHRLFDAGLISIDGDYIVEISSLLNGTTYKALDGKKIILPTHRSEYPSEAALALHRAHVFRRAAADHYLRPPPIVPIIPS